MTIEEYLYVINKKIMEKYGLFFSYNEKRISVSKPIDFVVTWVDGNDPVWKAEKEAYGENNNRQEIKDNGDERYRDWENFKYWFRAVEKYAPWVNRIYLVTYGHVPTWLNINADKLVIVSHDEFIPSKYLPTFSANPIELNLHRIPGLSELFVYFNDDMFLASPVSPEDFFNGINPKYCGVAYPLKNDKTNDSFQHQLFSTIGLANSMFCGEISEKIKKNARKWFSNRYGTLMKYNSLAYDQNYIQGMYFSHLPCPYRKSTFDKVWNIVQDELDETCKNAFRSPYDIIRHIFSISDIIEGNYSPVSLHYFGKVFASLNNQISDIDKVLSKRECKTICLNDSCNITKDEFTKTKDLINEIFENVFPRKSIYEL